MVATKFNKNGTIKIELYKSVKDWKGWDWTGYSQSPKSAQELAKAYHLMRFQPVRITKNIEKKSYDIWIYKGNK